MTTYTKKVLIVGAGILQSYIIKKSKELGYFTLAVDGDKDAIGFKYADKYSVIDIIDKEACLKYAEENEIDAVLTGATDYAVLTVSYIAKSLNLNGLDYELAKIIKNKFLVEEILYNNKIVLKKSFLVKKREELEEIRNQIIFPVMVKPCDGSGSRGVNYVDNFKDLGHKILIALNSSLSSKCIIEPFYKGDEYGVESFVYKGQIHNLIVLKKDMTKYPYYAELGHNNSMDEKTNDRILYKVNEIIKSLNINFGSVNMDLIVTDKDIYMIDIGARMGGNLIGSHMIPLSKGIDYMKLMIDAALNNSINIKQLFNIPLSSKLITLNTGKILFINKKSIDDIDCEYKILLSKENDLVHSYRNNLDGCGYVICTGNNMDNAYENSAKCLKIIQDSILIQGDK